MMKCPLTFNDPCYDRNDECREDCAWLIESKSETYACAIAFLACKNEIGYAVKNTEGASDECSMNCSPCIGMTREELRDSQLDQFEQCCTDAINLIPNTLDMLGDQ